MAVDTPEVAESQPPRLIRETFPVGPLRCNCSVLGDPDTLEAIVIDPGGDVQRILAVLAKHNLRLTGIVVTHAHLDHISGAASLRALTGAPVLYHQADLELVALMDQQAAWMGVPTPEVKAPDESIGTATELRVGRSTLRVLHTPGHTPGSICLYAPDHDLLLAGDTLFQGSVGRTDLWGGDTSTLLRSIQSELLHLPEGTLVIPGHGNTTSIGLEREHNIYLRNL
ncbi:MBL fold metallo-hydrolase [Terriglobus aquaticus]|uniref:MBL fold metallo-hydrolase n=1 Tax=Terriglobus aquaticus TaxID=940139 RepID=A0ABW9KJ71_9BACT|nr:MBL fold metallo-hydrolase [Terriglobus aquaticus]